MTEEEIEDLLGHYLDNIESAIDVAVGHLDRAELSDEDREKALKLIISRIKEII